jgi:hypothetical protein
LVALLGLGKMFVVRPRQTLLILAFSALQLYTITPIIQRYTRHALPLYPLVCILAGMGLSLLTDAVRFSIGWLSVRAKQPWQEKLIKSKPALLSAAPAFVLVVFLLLNYNQFSYTLSYVERVRQYKPDQVFAADYLSRILKPGDKVGILDLIPRVASDLKARHIPFEQIKLTDTPQELKARGITYVAGTDRIRAQYGSTDGTMWKSAFKAPGSKLAEFGSAMLAWAGYPVNNLYIFVARLPGS